MREEEVGFRRAAPRRKWEALTVEERGRLKECRGQCCISSKDGEMQEHPLAFHALADSYHMPDNWTLLRWTEHLQDLDKLRQYLWHFEIPI